MDSVMPLFAILGVDYSKYDDLLSCFTSGDTSVVLADLATMELLVMGEDCCRTALGITTAPALSATRVTQYTPDIVGIFLLHHLERMPHVHLPRASAGLLSRASSRIRRVSPTITCMTLSIGKLADQY